MNTGRQNEILKILYVKRKVSVKELSDILHVSEPAIRRDLALLETQRLLKRYYGGARIEANGVSELKVPYLMRELSHTEEKILIAKKAVSFVNPQNLIFIDSSSTAAAILPFLNDKRDVTVVTNGLRAQINAMDHNFRLISTGGILNRSAMAFYGEETLSTISNYFADICFISCSALDNTGFISDINPLENQVRRAMMRQSNSVYLLCSSEKIGIRKFHNLGSVKDITGIISVVEMRKNAVDIAKQKTILATE